MTEVTFIVEETGNWYLVINGEPYKKAYYDNARSFVWSAQAIAHFALVSGTPFKIFEKNVETDAFLDEESGLSDAENLRLILEQDPEWIKRDRQELPWKMPESKSNRF